MTKLAAAHLARSSRVQVLVIALIALALRLAFDARLALPPSPDTLDYLAAGRDLLQLRPMASNIRMPLYPVFLAGIGPHRVLIVQAVLSAATAVLAYYLAREIFRSTLAGSLAGLLAVFDPVSIYYADQQLSETLFTFLLILSLLFLYRRQYFAGSIVFVLSILVRPTFDLLAIPLLVVFCWRNDGALSWKRVARCVGIYVVVYIVLMSPWWWHNYEKYGTFVRLDLGDGIIARLEQSPQFAKYGLDWPKLRPITKAMDHPKNPVRRNAQLRHAAIEYVRAHPLQYAKLCVFRFGRFWSPVIHQDEYFGHPKLRYAAFAMTVFLYVLSLITLVSIRRPLPRMLLPLLLTIGYLAAVQILTHALPRYRVPIQPLLYVLASGAVLLLARAPKWLISEKEAVMRTR